MFTPGTPKPAGSGRRKGTPNKLTSNAAAVMAEMGCDPIRNMCEIATARLTGPDGQPGKYAYPPELRAKMNAELAQYVYPKLKATEMTVSGPDNGPIEVRAAELASLLTPAEVEAIRERLIANAGQPRVPSG